MKKLTEVKLYGFLADKYGPSYKLRASSPGNAIRALCHMLPGFRKDMIDHKYRMAREKSGEDYFPESLDSIELKFSKKDKALHIFPETYASAPGVDWVLIAWVSAAVVVGVGLTLALIPSVPGTDPEEDKKDQSAIFGGPVNVTEQGNGIPLIYGEVFAGSVVINSGLDVVDVPIGYTGGSGDGTVGETPGFGGPTIDYGQYDLYVEKGSGSSNRAAQEDPNSLRSSATARIVELISGGNNHGLVNGLKSIYLDRTKLQNADDTYNFKGIKVEQRLGLPDQEYIDGFSSQEALINVGEEVNIADGPVIRSITSPTVDKAKIILSLSGLYRQDTTTGDVRGTSVRVGIELQSDGGGYTRIITHDFNGKTNSAYQKAFLINLPAGGAPWDIKVVRDTPDTTETFISDEVTFETLIEVTENKLTYPYCSVVGLTIDAMQFGDSIPSRIYHWKGRKIRVPSNYNPVTRAYTGIWDGTFQVAYSNNPAWVYFDLLTDRMYGLGRRIDEDQVDEYALYVIGQYCDQMIDNGNGGTEPRFTINTVISKSQKAYEVLNYILSTFRSAGFWSSGAVTAVQDSPKDPTNLLTRSNMIDGVIDYEGSALDQMFSVVQVQWNNPDDLGQTDYEIVEDQSLISRIGRRVKDITAYGCTSRSQAIRAGKWTLEDQNNSRTMAKFSVGHDFASVRPGEIIAIEDPQFHNKELGGRIKTGSTTTVINLDRSVVLESGKTYTLMIAMGTGVHERAVTTSASTVTTVTVGTAFPTAPVKGAVWVLKSNVLEPRQFRIKSISENEEGSFEIMAVNHDPGKYARVEGGIVIEPLVYTDLPTGPILPPSDSAILEFIRTDGNSVTPSVQISWKASPDPRVSLYQVQMQRPGSYDWETVGSDTPTVSREIINVEPGSHSFRVRAVDGFGHKSPWLKSDHTLIASGEDIDDVTSLVVITDHTALQTKLTWAPPTDVRPYRYKVYKNSVDVFASADLIGLTDSVEFIVTEIGFYWIETVFMDVASNDPPGVEVEETDLPSPLWTRVDGRPENLEDLDPDAQQDIDDLFTTYGSTASAAASAAAALASESAAATHAATASTAATNSAAAQTAAEAALDAAEDEADAALASAIAAAGSATAASGSATAASGSATSASSSQTAAAGSATAAASSATAAAASATAASGSASAANTSASSASSSATAAGTSASSANTSALSAQAVANRLLPDRPAVGADFSGAASGSETTPTATAPLTSGTVVAVTGEGDVRQFTGNIAVINLGWIPLTTGHTYRHETRVRVTVDGTDNRLTKAFHVYNSSGTYLGSVSLTTVDSSFVVADGWRTDSVDVTTTTLLASYATAAYIRGRVQGGRNASNGYSGATWQCAFSRLTDVTSEAAAAVSASAANTSANTASASQTAAAASATAANTAKLAAETAQGSAESARDDAVTARDDADGHAATASTQATNAATSAGAAAGSATAASGSASTASTQATNASNSATSAASSSVSAQSVANRLLPDRVSVTNDFSNNTGSYPPETITAQTQGTVVAVSGEGNVREYSVNANVLTVGWLAVGSSRTFKMTARAAVTVDGTDNRLAGWFAVYTADGTYLGISGGGFLDSTWTAAEGWNDMSFTRTSEDILASYPTAGYVRARVQGGRTVSSGTYSGATWQLASLRFEDITAVAAAEGSASAASTSASSASTSASGASTSATAAAASATTAATQASNASTSATSASTSAGNAASSATTAGTHATNALGYASSASSSASAASASETSAASSANLSAQLAAGSINKSASFTDNANATGVPTNWTSWTGVTSANATRVAGMGANPYAVQIVSTTNLQCGIRSSLNAGEIQPGWYVIEADVTLNSGTFNDATVWLRLYQADNTTAQDYFLDFDVDQTTEGTVPSGSPTTGRIYRWRKLVQVTSAVGANASQGLYAINHLGTASAANDLTWHRCAVRAASQAEIEARAATTALVTTNANVSANAAAIVIANASIATTNTTVSANFTKLMAGGLLKNPKFMDALVSGTPTGWTSWSSGTGTLVNRMGFTDAKAFRVVSGAGNSSGINQYTGGNTAGSVVQGQKYTLRMTTQLIAGTYNGAGGYVVFYDVGGSTTGTTLVVSMASAPDLAGVTSNSSADLRTWEAEIVAPTGSVKARLYAMNHWSSHTGGLSVANTIDWYECDFFPSGAVSVRLATAEADINTVETAIANESSARATEVTALTVRLAAGEGHGLVANPTFQNVWSGTAVPPGWLSGDNGAGTCVARVGSAGNAYRLPGGAGAEGFNYQVLPGATAQPAGKYKLRVVCRRTSGGFTGAGAQVNWYNSSGTYISTTSMVLATYPNTNGVIATDHDGVTTWETIMTAPAGAYRGDLLFGSHYSGWGSTAVANSIDWHEVDLTPQSFADATVTEVKTAVVDGSGAYSYYGMKVGAGNRFASIEALASTKTNISQLKMTADKFTVQTASTDKEVFEVTGDTVTIDADLNVGGGITVGGVARLKVALESIKKTGADGAAITWGGGASIGNIPEYVLDIASLAPLTTGEAYNVYLTGVTATGATVYAKIATPGTTTTITQSTDAAGGGGDPDRVMAKSDSADAYDGVYNFRVVGTLTVTSYNEGGFWSHDGSLEIETWFNDGGGWDQGPTIYLGVEDVGLPYISSSNETGSHAFDVTVPINWANAIGAGSTYDFGVSTGLGSGTLTDLHTVSYIKQISSGLRTASPNGETVKITAFPRNA